MEPTQDNLQAIFMANNSQYPRNICYSTIDDQNGSYLMTTIQSLSNTTDSVYSVSLLVKVSSFLVSYIQPVLCITGIVGNFVSFLVFLSKRLNKTSSNIYLASLSLASIVLCVCAFFTWLENIHVKTASKPFLCQSFVFLAYVSSFLAIWFVVCITFENYMVTIHTQIAVRICTASKAKTTVSVLSIIAIILYSYALWTTESKDGYCITRYKYLSIIKGLTLADVTLTLFIPSCAILSFIIPILIKLICFSEGQTRTCCGGGENQPRLVRGKRNTAILLRITRVLLVIGLTYVTVGAPMYVNQIRLVLTSPSEQMSIQEEMALYHICLIFYYTTFTLNFFVNIIWSQNYRKVLIKLLKKPKRNLGRKIVSLPLMHVFRTNDRQRRNIRSI